MADDGAMASNLECISKNKMADFITVFIRVPKFFIQRRGSKQNGGFLMEINTLME